MRILAWQGEQASFFCSAVKVFQRIVLHVFGPSPWGLFRKP